MSTTSSPTTLHLSWRPPPEETQNGRITGYDVNVTEILTGRTMEFNTQDTQLTVNPLHPYYVYHWSVVARNSAGRGPYAPNETVQMPEGGK